ncbi:hypothetical protein DFH08DRAFT_828531 [Mycena albidolilacea]|uniref:Uncharacterized protein n=1 Tax=Mycena albidolilacea TaxID=1033008 RepID=A0AAD6YW19_9AGAR|nr:hypothetical protein DFH08DRAFT_828531 [Mycena albidolilacea]
MCPGHPLPGALLCTPEYIPDASHEDRWAHPGPFYAVVSKEWVGAVTSRTSLSRMLKRYPGARTWQAAPWPTFERMWNLDCTEYHEHGGDLAPFIPITPDSSPPSSPSSLSDSVASRQSSTTSSALLSPRHTPILSPPPSPGKSQAKLTKDELALLASFRPGPGPISPQRLKQQFERILGPRAVVISPSSQPTAQEEYHPGEKLRIVRATVEATLCAGGQVRAERKPSADLEQPQTPPRMLRTERGSSHEAAQSPRRELFNFLADDVRDMKI